MVIAIPLPQPNYDRTLQIPQSVFDFQKPNILTRTAGLWKDGSATLIADSEPIPSAPAPNPNPPENPIHTPGGEDNQENLVHPYQESGIKFPLLPAPDVPDTTHSQPPEFKPSNGDSDEGAESVYDFLFHLGVW